VILAYPVLLAAAVYVGLGRRAVATGRGAAWFGAWLLTGAVFMFSFLTGLSIGLLVLPLATALLFWSVWHSPFLREAAGFPAGAALTLVAVLLGY
jgi:hypothetical protein